MKQGVFVSSVQKELEDERLVVQNLINTDSFLFAHCTSVLYEYEPASPDKALEGCIKVLDACQVYILIVAQQYGNLVGDLSITHIEYRRAKERGLPFWGSSKVTAASSENLALTGYSRSWTGTGTSTSDSATSSSCRRRFAPRW